MKKEVNHKQNRPTMPNTQAIRTTLEKELAAIVRRYKTRKRPFAAIFSDVRCEVVGGYLYLDPDYILQMLCGCIIEEIPDLTDDVLYELKKILDESVVRNSISRSTLLSLEMDYI
jgi:hypothetical protein